MEAERRGPQGDAGERERVRLSTSRGYREIALRLAGGHVVALGEHFSGKPIRQVLQCNATIHLRQEMYPSRGYTYSDIALTMNTSLRYM